MVGTFRPAILAKCRGGWVALLKEQLRPSPSEVDVAMKRGLEALLW